MKLSNAYLILVKMEVSVMKELWHWIQIIIAALVFLAGY